MPVTTIWYWPRDFVLRSCEFVQPRAYRRAAISLLLAPPGALCAGIGGQRFENSTALLLGPAVTRDELRIDTAATGGYGWVIDFAPGSPAFLRLRAALAGRSVWQPPIELAARLAGQLAQFAELADAAQAPALHAALAGCFEAREVTLDGRVQQALSIIDRVCLDEIQIACIASELGLSESRLRALVRGQLSCNLAQYARWSAAWRVIRHWHPGMTLTDAAHAGGFHDLAHANHAANDMFGMSPSRVLNGERLALIQVDAQNA